MKSKDDPTLLFGSVSLTHEEETLRLELVEWLKAKLLKGHRPVALYAAFKSVTKQASNPDKKLFARPNDAR